MLAGHGSGRGDEGPSGLERPKVSHPASIIPAIATASSVPRIERMATLSLPEGRGRRGVVALAAGDIFNSLIPDAKVIGRLSQSIPRRQQRPVLGFNLIGRPRQPRPRPDHRKHMIAADQHRAGRANERDPQAKGLEHHDRPRR